MPKSSFVVAVFISETAVTDSKPCAAINGHSSSKVWVSFSQLGKSCHVESKVGGKFMIYIPSQQTFESLDVADAGMWIERDADEKLAVIVKMPVNVLKGLFLHKNVRILVGVVQREEALVQCVGVEVADNTEAPWATFGTQSDLREQQLFEELLNCRELRMFVFDELSRYVGAVMCRIESGSANDVLGQLADLTPRYVGDDMQLRRGALDLFQECLDMDFRCEQFSSKAFGKVSLTVTSCEAISISATTSDGVNGIRIDDGTEGEEGSGLEQSALQLLDNSFPKRLYRSPEVGEKGASRELTDVMGISSTGVVLIEAKVHAVLASEGNRCLAREKAATMRHIKKALAQLAGAIRSLRAKRSVWNRRGGPVSIDSDELINIQAVVLLSSLEPWVDWLEVAALVQQSTKENRACFNVLDLRSRSQTT